MLPSRDDVLGALRTIQDPDLGTDIVSAGLVGDVTLEGSQVHIRLRLTSPACPLRSHFVEECQRVVARLPGVGAVHVHVETHVAGARPLDRRPIPGVEVTLAVASGKGGVGKSTVAVGLTAALHRMGARAGLMDADVYGPSVALMATGATPVVSEGGRMKPSSAGGIPVFSMGLITQRGAPLVWRGPLVSRAVEEMLFQVDWPELDYLVVDLPPGTGDAPLTLAQRAPLAGVILVTTPHGMSTEEVARSATMFQRVAVPILGIVENMSWFVCPHCGHQTQVFPGDGGQELATQVGVPLLSRLPLLPALAQASQEGTLWDSASSWAETFLPLACAVVARLAALSRG